MGRSYTPSGPRAADTAASSLRRLRTFPFPPGSALAESGPSPAMALTPGSFGFENRLHSALAGLVGGFWDSVFTHRLPIPFLR